ncbi:hypothetical protein AUEXF2481DRAFT_568342 [Aureobasidium subglaciale EXF-2481]|uniref:NmrA-like domain-containing protein n=1 Tax=Aureobasidium subglaciale (strain EXF-2481) TaxID=1043005 RepID=A0A074XY48_AURSE|nr:uncharacterized protein AUEXF2481DRAFT_568342 [Aureobasidium subglaciale EXF-2481]KAI5201972.1 hypothetical protein E4T38_05873 [Aureobasidium subglaciale]KAI5220858.1 hypothetical protein E4T40_05804 [Aureobasidium subglaciale]KAI5224749.1 hypothetical protein E4T41_05536 [Aureobasidium subglaciale]KAI5260930.1 hypothetical protein E4T46_05627 [Aureobasidium subglaciale]KEQ90488.1 hypothetical protein AUEXF2481DRAFT_568342 [Aureobasidium subglaciale EXF-2481]
MVIVALAGWNSGLGRVIWDALQQSEKHKGFILTRKVPEAVDTKRFAPSAFAIPYPWGSVDVLPPLKYYFEAIETLEKSDLEWTVFLNGVFLDYHGMLQIKAHLAPNVFAIDMVNKVAAKSGDWQHPSHVHMVHGPRQVYRRGARSANLGRRESRHW